MIDNLLLGIGAMKAGTTWLYAQLNKHPDNSLLSYDVKVEMGEPLDKILEEAHSGNYDILIISKHGHRFSVKDAVMGDTARRVVRRCQIPVLVVPLAE